MTPGEPAGGISHTFVVAIEYDGLDPHTDDHARVNVREHAYDLGTAALADHEAEVSPTPRVGFPAANRGWNTTPESARCPHCDDAVLAVVRAAIKRAFTTDWT